MREPTVLQSTPYGNKIIGFAGPTPLEITLDHSGKIADIKLLQNKETPAYIQKVIDDGLLEAWKGLTPQEALAKQVDAVSGATFSSRGIIETVQKRLEIYREQDHASDTSYDMIGMVLFSLLTMGCILISQRRRVFAKRK